MKCPECGFDNHDKAQYCATCGFDLETYRKEKAEEENKKLLYEKGIEFYNSKKYEEAREVFNRISSFLDSQNYLDEIEKAELKIYTQGKALYDQGAYKEALKIFNEISSYSDTASLISKSNEILSAREQAERLAKARANAKRLAKEKEREKAIYDKGVELYNSKQYEEASKVFNTIPSFLDAKKYLGKIKALKNKEIAEEKAKEEKENAKARAKKDKIKNLCFFLSGLVALALGVALFSESVRPIEFGEERHLLIDAFYVEIFSIFLTLFSIYILIWSSQKLKNAIYKAQDENGYTKEWLKVNDKIEDEISLIEVSAEKHEDWKYSIRLLVVYTLLPSIFMLFLVVWTIALVMVGEVTEIVWLNMVCVLLFLVSFMILPLVYSRIFYDKERDERDKEFINSVPGFTKKVSVHISKTIGTLDPTYNLRVYQQPANDPRSTGWALIFFRTLFSPITGIIRCFIVLFKMRNSSNRYDLAVACKERDIFYHYRKKELIAMLVMAVVIIVISFLFLTLTGALDIAVKWWFYNIR